MYRYIIKKRRQFMLYYFSCTRCSATYDVCPSDTVRWTPYNKSARSVCTIVQHRLIDYLYADFNKNRVRYNITTTNEAKSKNVII